MTVGLPATAGGLGPGRDVFLRHAEGGGVVRAVELVVLCALLCLWVAVRYGPGSGRGS